MVLFKDILFSQRKSNIQIASRKLSEDGMPFPWQVLIYLHCPVYMVPTFQSKLNGHTSCIINTLAWFRDNCWLASACDCELFVLDKTWHHTSLSVNVPVYLLLLKYSEELKLQPVPQDSLYSVG
jgi:hypothetical protein